MTQDQPFIYLLDVSQTSDWNRLRKFQDIRKHLVPFTGQPFSFLSHRWLDMQNCDTSDGVLLDHLQSLEGFVWIDYCCLPQLPRCPDDEALFDLALSQMHVINSRASRFRLAHSEDYFRRGWCLAEFFVYLTRAPISTDCIAVINERVIAASSPENVEDYRIVRFLSQWNVLELMPAAMTEFMSLTGVATDVCDVFVLDGDDLKRAINFFMKAVLDHDEEQIRNFDADAGDTALIEYPLQDDVLQPDVLSVIQAVPVIKIKKRSGEVIESVLSYKLAHSLFESARLSIEKQYQPKDNESRNTRANQERDTRIVTAIKKRIRKLDEAYSRLQSELRKVVGPDNPYGYGGGFDAIQCTNGRDITICKRIINEALNGLCGGSRQRVHTIAHIIRSAYLEFIRDCDAPTGCRAERTKWLAIDAVSQQRFGQRVSPKDNNDR